VKKLLIFASLILLFSTINANAQNRKSVSVAEVNGTFRSFFDGKFKGNYNEIKILALGKGKLRVAFDLTYPFINGMGELMANVGIADARRLLMATRRFFLPTKTDNVKSR
jgi:ribosome-associated toxin RatA of RatAB toxin-antitoxin module